MGARDEARAYAEDGTVVVRGAFAAWVDALRDGVAALMADPSPNERSHQPEDGSARFFQDPCNSRPAAAAARRPCAT